MCAGDGPGGRGCRHQLFSHKDEAEAVADQVHGMGRQTLVRQGDVADCSEVSKLVKAVAQRFGRIDIAVCNSYYSKREPFLKIDVAQMQRTFDVTFWETFHAAQAAAQQVMKQGHGVSMVFTSSLYAFIPHAGSLAYNTAKAGVNHMAETIANELATYRIRVNAIQPGWPMSCQGTQYLARQSRQFNGSAH